MSNAVVLDTNVIVALLDQGDSLHGRAVELVSKVQGARLRAPGRAPRAKLAVGSVSDVPSGPRRRSAESAVRGHGGGAIPVVRIDVSKLDATLDGLIEVAMLDAGAERSAAAEQEAQVFAGVQCPWCFESMEIAIEADLEGSYVQDCEVCCRPWAVTVRRDEDGELTVDVGRA
jgi:hypothetical protein